LNIDARAAKKHSREELKRHESKYSTLKSKSGNPNNAAGVTLKKDSACEADMANHMNINNKN
jgi:hypothetical protein